MIGVLAAPAERGVVEEFFQLFKTPWEFLRPQVAYDVVITTGINVPDNVTRLLLIYQHSPSANSIYDPVRVQPPAEKRELHWGARCLPVYGRLNACVGAGQPLATNATSEAVVRAENISGQIRVRLGFNLWVEIETLLRHGQPAANAATPTLDLHIELLRGMILNAGLRLAEIPPVPAGYAFLACLTHDVDHPTLRPHRFDHTLAGFLRRALVDTPWAAARGRVPSRHILLNYGAALKLPLIHAGLLNDFWLDFERYAEIENGLGSTFFVLPRRGDPGCALTGSGRAPARRAASYSPHDIRPQLDRLYARGCEIALHGIDAWIDEHQGHREQSAVSRPTPTGEIGVRMHWLYFNAQSHSRLEAAGFSYDSTIGYNDTIGYRAGTGQPYQPLAVTRLLELPMHIMDTALFYPSYLNLTAEEAQDVVTPVIDHAYKAGGTVTVNWHDRSLFPERLWGEFYIDLVQRLLRRGAWFATAAAVATWFRDRRATTFSTSAQGTVQAEPALNREGQPPLQLRLHEPRAGLLQTIPEINPVGTFLDHPIHTTGFHRNRREKPETIPSLRDFRRPPNPLH